MKKILIIGGTQFVGRNLVEQLQHIEGYDLTLFNRGKTNPDIFPDVKRLKGDRRESDDIRQITEQDWDCIIDISGYWPTALEQQLKMQKGKVGRYVYISTSSHYQFDTENPHLINEDEPIVACSEEQKQSNDMQYYNELKAECERLLVAQEDLDLIILRPGLIIGKHDPTDRLYYWFYKAHHRDELLVADNGSKTISFTHVKDLAATMIKCIEADHNYNVYNCVSFNTNISSFLDLFEQKTGKTIKRFSASTQTLLDNKVGIWTGLPLWIDGDYMMMDNTRIKTDLGIEMSSIEETVDALLDFYGNDKQWSELKLRPDPISDALEKELIQTIKS